MSSNINKGECIYEKKSTFFGEVLCHTNTVKVILVTVQVYCWRKTSGVLLCVILGTTGHPSRTTDVP